MLSETPSVLTLSDWSVFINAVLVFSERELTFISERRYLLSPVRLSFVVCNVRAPYSGGSNFRQYFYGISYLGHPLTSTENFTKIIPVVPLRRGS